MSFWKTLFGKEKSPAAAKGDDARYAQEREIARSGDAPARVKLAGSPKTRQEILYYLAEKDPDPEVRQAVAGNAATPVQASSVLAGDSDEDVRFALANRLLRLLPGLSQDKKSQIYSFAVQALGTLALDEVLKIRVALSSALKDCAGAPPDVVKKLARDIERDVSEPILRFCLALPDEDLLEILKSHPESWAVQAIAGRPEVSEDVSQAVIDTDDEKAGLILMENKGAMIHAETMATIVDKAKDIPSWQKPIAVRKSLPPELAKELAGFVDQSVRTVLLERTDFDGEVMEEISRIVQRRIDFMDISGRKGSELESLVLSMLKNGNLGDEAVADAIAVREYDFVVMAIAALLRTNVQRISSIMAMHAPKPIVAICWKAGLSMRTALAIQKDIAKVPPKELIYPRGGTDYPLSDKDLNWQIEFLEL
jgi:uncharacterized protein (DUF2336 family)